MPVLFLLYGIRIHVHLPLAFNSFIIEVLIIIGAIYFTKEFLKTEEIIFDIESLPILEADETVERVLFLPVKT